MKRPIAFTLLVCLSLVASVNAIANATPSSHSDAAANASTSTLLPLRLHGHSLQVCQPMAGSKVPLCRSGPLPARFGAVARSSATLPSPQVGIAAESLRAGPEAGDPPDLPSNSALALLFEADGRTADLCVYDGAVIRCARLAVQVPKGITVDAWSLPDGYTALSFVRTAGVNGTPDPHGRAARRFQAGFNVALKAIRRAMAEALAQPAATVGEVNEWDNSGDDSGESGGGQIPVVEIHAPAPQPVEIDAIPPVTVEGLVDVSVTAIPQLPGREENENLAAVLNPCVVSPIVTICVKDRRPVPPAPEELPRGRRPWFPQSWCNWSGVFCTEGQEPRDNDRGPNSETSGKTMDQLKEICDVIYARELEECYAGYVTSGRDPGVYAGCKERAGYRWNACYSTAERLTDKGAHPAP